PVQPYLKPVLSQLVLTHTPVEDQVLILRCHTKLAVQPKIHVGGEPLHLVLIQISSRIEPVVSCSNDADVIEQFYIRLGEVPEAGEMPSTSDSVSAALYAKQQAESLDRIPGVKRKPVEMILEPRNLRESICFFFSRQRVRMRQRFARKARGRQWPDAIAGEQACHLRCELRCRRMVHRIRHIQPWEMRTAVVKVH